VKETAFIGKGEKSSEKIQMGEHYLFEELKKKRTLKSEEIIFKKTLGKAVSSEKCVTG
jgi:hypothetical protein